MPDVDFTAAGDDGGGGAFKRRMTTDPERETLDACPLCSSIGIAAIDPERCLCLCRECGLVFDNPRPTAKALTEYYSGTDKYESWLVHAAERNGLWQRRLRKMLKTRRQGSLLDIGAGIGQFLHFAQNHFAPVVGTEVSKSACAIARERFGIAMEEGEVEYLDLGDKRFDCITLFHVLEHVPRPGRLLSRVHDLCAAEGTVFLAVPNELYSVREGLKGCIKLALKRCGFHRFRGYGKFGFSRISFTALHEEIHLSHFTPKTIVLAVKRAGFEISRVSLDPFFVAKGPVSWFEQVYFMIHLLINRVSGLNLYDAIWVEAKKADKRPPCPACGAITTHKKKKLLAPPYRIFSCLRCACEFADPMKAASKEWYEGSPMYRFDTGAIREDLRWYEKMFLKDRPHVGNGRLLNIGCGMNGFLAEVRDAGYTVTAVDFNEQAIEFTREKLGITNAVVADIAAFAQSFRGKPFDVITLFEVIEHLERPAALLAALRNILAPDGFLCISVPNRKRLLPLRDPWDHPPHHLTWWDRQSIAAFLERYGFTVSFLEVSRVSPDEMVDKTRLLFFVPFLERWRDRSGGITRRIVSSMLWSALKLRTGFHTVLAFAAGGLGYDGKNMYIRATNIGKEIPLARNTPTAPEGGSG
jgi:2-polyprenyl-3-methyl-5-hydroxy-6-metoxy-1,4-benzoquinol methylase